MLRPYHRHPHHPRQGPGAPGQPRCAQEGRVAGAGRRGRIQEKEVEVQRLYSAIQQASEKEAFEKVRQLSDHLAKTQAALDQYMVEGEKLAR
jgi:hypothetical protein